MNTSGNNQAEHTKPNAKKTPKTKAKLFSQVFWLSFLVASLAYAWYSFYVPSNEVAWAKNITEAKEISSESNKNMLLFFTGDWCVPCKIMKREIFADHETMLAINAQVVPLEVNIDDASSKELVELYNIGATPILIFTDSKGEVLDYSVGKINKETFHAMLKGLNK